MSEIEQQEFVGFAVEARKYDTLLTEKYKSRKAWAAPDEKEVRAYIPGTVVEICVEVGQFVKKGELLLIHEAMKMQNRIVMPFDGEIAELNVVEGDRIPKHHLMLRIK